jgi:hypothetical protein
MIIKLFSVSVAITTGDTGQTQRPKRELGSRADPPRAVVEVSTVRVQMNRQSPTPASVRGFPDVSVAVEIADGRRCVGAVVITH